MKDHIHLLLMIPPKYSVANTVGFLKGKSAIRIFREYLQVKRNFTGRHFWTRGYCVSTAGLDEQINRYPNIMRTQCRAYLSTPATVQQQRLVIYEETVELLRPLLDDRSWLNSRPTVEA